MDGKHLAVAESLFKNMLAVNEFTEFYDYTISKLNTGWRYKKRPGLDYFLDQIKYPQFEVVLFTKETFMVRNLTLFLVLFVKYVNCNLKFEITERCTDCCVTRSSESNTIQVVSREHQVR